METIKHFPNNQQHRNRNNKNSGNRGQTEDDILPGIAEKLGEDFHETLINVHVYKNERCTHAGKNGADHDYPAAKRSKQGSKFTACRSCSGTGFTRKKSKQNKCYCKRKAKDNIEPIGFLNGSSPFASFRKEGILPITSPIKRQTTSV